MASTLRLLHLEQNEEDSGMALALLAEDGINCQTRRASTLEGFTDALETEVFDLVLSDLSRVVDGLAALSIARKICPELPFIFLTDVSDARTAYEATKIGATDYLLKGRLSHLAPAVKKALSDAEARQRHPAGQVSRSRGPGRKKGEVW